MKPFSPPRGRGRPSSSHTPAQALAALRRRRPPHVVHIRPWLGATAPQASASGMVLYAYAKGGASSPTSCPQTASTSQQCTLAEALSLAKAGSTVVLATPGGMGHYVGNWTVATQGTSASPLTIEPAPGVSGPVLDGNRGKCHGLYDHHL